MTIKTFLYQHSFGHTQKNKLMKEIIIIHKLQKKSPREG